MTALRFVAGNPRPRAVIRCADVRACERRRIARAVEALVPLQLDDDPKAREWLTFDEVLAIVRGRRRP